MLETSTCSSPHLQRLPALSFSQNSTNLLAKFKHQVWNRIRQVIHPFRDAGVWMSVCVALKVSVISRDSSV